MRVAEEFRTPGSAGNAGPRRVSMLSGILRRLCPRCRAGRIFSRSQVRRFPKMHERCPVCGLRFEREEGYFLGAMYISYGIALVAITTLSLLVWKFTELSFERIVLWGFILFLPFVYPITIMSRVLWIYLDQAVDPEKPGNRRGG